MEFAALAQGGLWPRLSPSGAHQVLEPVLVAVAHLARVFDRAHIGREIALAGHRSQVHEGITRLKEAGLKSPETWIPLPVPEERIVDDVVEVDQALPEEEIEGVRLVLGDDLQMGPPTIPEKIAILEVEEDCEKDQGDEIEEDETPQGMP